MLLSREKQSLVGWVIDHGEMTIAQAGKDQRHNRQVEEEFSLKSNLILCFPLLMNSGDCYGAVELIDTSARGDRMNLDQDYLELLQTMVEMGSMVLNNSLEYAAKTEENKLLRERLASSAGAPRIIGQSEALGKALETGQKLRQDRFPGPHERRKRHRQGAFRKRDPQRKPPGPKAFRGHKLQRHPGHPFGKRTVRLPQGSL